MAGSFEDWQRVTFDRDEGTFTILRNSGKTHTYDIKDEAELAFNILMRPDEVDIFRAVHIQGYYRKSGVYVRGYTRHTQKSSRVIEYETYDKGDTFRFRWA